MFNGRVSARSFRNQALVCSVLASFLLWSNRNKTNLTACAVPLLLCGLLCGRDSPVAMCMTSCDFEPVASVSKEKVARSPGASQPRHLVQRRAFNRRVQQPQSSSFLCRMTSLCLGAIPVTNAKTKIRLATPIVLLLL